MKYLRILFTFLGYCTFVSLVGAATFWYIGYRRSQTPVETTVTFRDISMTPATVAEKTLPEFEPITYAPPSKEVARPAAKPARKKPVVTAKPAPKTKPAIETPVAKPITYAAPRKEVARPAAKPARKKPVVTAKPAAPRLPELPPCTLTFRATDNSASPRTGRGRVNLYETTELEKQVIQRMEDLRQLQEAATKIRNPPYHESGIVRLFSGN